MAVIGNAAVIFLFSTVPRLRRFPANTYIISLALADFLIGLLGIPAAIATSLGYPKHFKMCLLSTSFLLTTCTISILSLVMVTIDRYIAVVHPFWYRAKVSVRRVRFVVGACWVLGSLVGGLPSLGWNRGKPTKARCVFLEVNDLSYLVFLFWTTIIFPSVFMAIVYSIIYTVANQQLKKMVASSSCLHKLESKKEKKKACLFNRIFRKQKDLNTESPNCNIVIKNNNCSISSDSLSKVNNEKNVKTDDNDLKNSHVSTSLDLQTKSILDEANEEKIKIFIQSNPKINEVTTNRNSIRKQILEKSINKDTYVVCYLKFNKSTNSINRIEKHNTCDKIDTIVNKENKCYSKDDSDVKSVKFTKSLPLKNVNYNSFNSIKTTKSFKKSNESWNENTPDKLEASYEKSIENISKKNNSKRTNHSCHNGREIRILRSLTVIVVTFILSWSPLYIMNTIMYHDSCVNIPGSVFYIFIIVSHLNSVWNPFIYAWGNSDFKNAFVDLVKKRRPGLSP